MRVRLLLAGAQVWLFQAHPLLSFFHFFFSLASEYSGPRQVGEFKAGENQKPWPCSLHWSHLFICTHLMTYGFVLAGGPVFSSGRGLMHLLFLFRASGTQQFSPTGKYKADGVLETVRLSGKLSRNLWLCLGTVFFHISKSSPAGAGWTFPQPRSQTPVWD
jgi:hypothetical protein